MKIWVSVLLLAVAAGSGCASRQAAPSSQPAASTSTASETTPKIIVTPESDLTGTVVRVNRVGRFVVLSFPLTAQPVLDQHLTVYRHGMKVGEVRVSGPRMDENIVADILNGEAQPGDEVKDR